MTLGDVVEELFRRHGRRLHIGTIRHWIVSGVRGHRLPAAMVGGRWIVQPADLEVFLRALDR